MFIDVCTAILALHSMSHNQDKFDFLTKYLYPSTLR